MPPTDTSDAAMARATAPLDQRIAKIMAARHEGGALDHPDLERTHLTFFGRAGEPPSERRNN